MKLQVDRYSIKVIPENAQDEAFIEEVLGLKAGGTPVMLRRVNVHGTSSQLAYAEARRDP
jgi:hypothetical protein